jgi:hypothetical protein
VADNHLTTDVATPAGAVTIRRDFSGEEIMAGADMSPAAAAAAARARIEARVVLAMRNPRDEDKFRKKLLHDCKRPGFADVAMYRKPVGRKRNAQTGEWEEAFAEDFSIRFIEAALRHWKNVHTTAAITYEDDRKMLINVEVLDIENNIAHSRDMMLEKLVERREIKKGRTVRGVRENSYGDTVYLVDATADEFRNKFGAECSKLMRDNGKRLLPGDVLEECRRAVQETMADENAKDPDSARKKIFDRFGVLGISPDMLKAYLERPVESLNPRDLAELGVLYNGLRDGDIVWADVMRVKHEPAEGEAAQAVVPSRPTTKLKERILKARETPAAPPATGGESGGMA